MSIRALFSVWSHICVLLWFCRLRLAREYGKAMPTKNEKEGCIKSCKEQPIHGIWLWCQAIKAQKVDSGNFSETEEKFRTSAIINNMTNPRNASIDATR